MIARFGLLECGKNFKGTQSEMCTECNCVDDENHRLNHCIKQRNINLYDQTEKVDYTEYYGGGAISSTQTVFYNIIKIRPTKLKIIILG